MPQNPNLVTAIGPQDTEISISFTEPANSPAGSIFQGSILASNPLAGSNNQVTVPSSEVWHILNTYNVGGVATNCVDSSLVIIINNYVQNVQVAVSSTNLSLLRGFALSESIPIPPSGTLAVSLYSLAAVGATGGTQVQKLKIRKIPL